MCKKVLLIAGGGTLGNYVSQELLGFGVSVDVICLEDKVSKNANLTYYKHLADYDFLKKLFELNKYDGVINFVHYVNIEEFKQVYELIIKNTEHFIFISSYRVYANVQKIITETAPRLFDVVKDQNFLSTENYAVPKSKCEDYLFNECYGEKWTIVRPVISFSSMRMDLLTYSGHTVLQYAKDGKELILPKMVKNYGAGLDWAGNSAKIMAHLLFKEHTFGQAYTIYSGQNLTWGEIAEIYEKLIGLKVKWTTEEEYADQTGLGKEYIWLYDRKFDRKIDCAKVFNATGLNKQDFLSIEDGIKIELENIKNKE